MHKKLRRSLGVTICNALDDTSVIEIMVNPGGNIWVDRLSSGMERTGADISSANLLDALGTIAALLDTEINADKNSLSGELPIDNGSRVQGAIPSIVEAPLLTIRKKSSMIFSLSDYVEKEKLTQEQHDFLVEAIANRKNILVSGGTGSGKTTFCNALLQKLSEISPRDRVVIIEDTTELQSDMENCPRLHTNGTTSLNDLLRITMRLRPDRIVIGEVRGGEALDLLKSWNTGHPGGFATVHANSAPAALTRLEQLISEVSASPMKELISEAVDVVVHLQRHSRIGPKVQQIVEVVSGIENNRFVWRELEFANSSNGECRE